MAQHGYLGDGYGMRGDHGDDDYGRGRDRDRERGFGDRDRERSYGDRDRFRDRDHDRDRGRNFMFDDDRQSRSHDDWEHGRREREGWGGDPNRMNSHRNRDDDRNFRSSRDRDDDRGFMEKARDWFSDDDDDQRGRQQNRGWTGQDRHDERPTFGGFGNQTGWESIQGRDQGRSRPTPHRDDHYRSWREKQMQALDRDYEEYCRDCEQKFHQDFDSWRQNRQQQGSQPSGQSGKDDQQVRMGSDRPSVDSPRAGTDPQGGGLNTDRSTEVGAGSMPGQGATSTGAGSELGGAAGSFVNEGTGGNSGGRKKTV